MGSCCKPHSAAGFRPGGLSRRNSSVPPILYYLEFPFLYTYNPQHHIAWKEELSVDGHIDKQYRACALSPSEILLVSKGHTFLVFPYICSAIRRAPISPTELWKGDLLAYRSQAFAVNASAKLYNREKDEWTLCVDLWSELTEYYGACVSSSQLYVVGASQEAEVAVHGFDLPEFQEKPVAKLKYIPARPLICYPVSDNQILLLAEYEETVFNSITGRFGKTVPSHLIDRSPAVMQVHWDNTVFVIKESGCLLEVRSGVCIETRIPDKDEQLSGNNSVVLERCPATTLLEHDKSMRQRPGLYTYAANFQEEEYFCMQLNTLSMVVREIPAADEPIICRGAGWCVLPTGDLLLAGGFDTQNSPTSEVMVWNTISKMRSSTTPLPSAQAYVCLVVCERCVYALGAVASPTPHTVHMVPERSYFQRFEWEESAWSPLDAPWCPVLQPGIAHWRDTVYTFGGCAADGEVLAFDLVLSYSTLKLTWQRLTVRYPEAAALISTVALPGGVLCFCGLNLTTHALTSSCYLFAAEKFQKKAESTFRTDSSMPQVGYASNSHLICIVETSGVWSVYDPQLDKWLREEELRVTTDI